MKRKIIYYGLIVLFVAVVSGLIGWSIGNPDRTGYQLTIAALQDRCAALEEIIETGNWTPTAWGFDGKPLYPVKPSWK